jgi:hypothetical protein
MIMHLGYIVSKYPSLHETFVAREMEQLVKEGQKLFYREAERIGGKGLERIYYIVFKQGSKVFEEKVGRQYSDDMTPARAARIRVACAFVAH